MKGQIITPRSRVLLVILLVVILGAGYLKLFWEPVAARQLAAENRIAQAQDEALLAQSKLLSMQQMEKKLDEIRSEADYSPSIIPEYDNIDNVMIQLDEILSSAADYQLNFSELTLGDTLIARPIRMTFSASNYDAARYILIQLYHCPYRCFLSEITVTTDKDAAEQGDVTAQPVSVTLTATFYETPAQEPG